jgi:hypothetical protein
MNKKLLLLSSACVLGALVSACTPGASGPSIPAAVATATPAGATPTPAGATPTPAPAGTTSTSFVISLNGGGETILSKNARPQFVSPSTQSITFAVDGGATTTQNVSASATNCASSNGGVKCTIPLASLAAGAHTLSLTTWSGTSGTGNKLGANSSIGFTVVANQANTVSGVIGGIATSVNIVPVSNAVGSMTQGFTIYESTAPSGFVANPVDASGNAIVGPGAPTISVSMDNSGATATAGSSQNAFTIAAASGEIQPILTNLGHLRVALTPVANSGGTAINTQYGVFGEQPRIYVLSTNFVVTAYDQLGNVQTDPNATDQINTAITPIAITWDPSGSQLIVLSTAGIQTFQWPGDNIGSTLSSGTNVPQNFSLAWDDVDQLAFWYGGSTGKLESIGPWPTPTTITPLGSTTPEAYISMVSSGATAGAGQQQDYLYATGSSTVYIVETNGTAAALSTQPTVGTISGIAYDPSSSMLFVAGSTGVASYTSGNLNASAGFAGVTGATSIAVNPANGLVYVAEGAASKIAVFNEAGVAQFSFSTGTYAPAQIIAVP